MRIWHVGMLHALPEKQLRGQLRELVALVGMFDNPRFVRHPLIIKLKQYSRADFVEYVNIYCEVMNARGFKVKEDTKNRILDKLGEYEGMDNLPFQGWHNDRYLTQCFYNLEEKFDLGLISEKEFRVLENFYYNKK